MILKNFTKSALFALTAFSLPTQLGAQSIDDVKSDVLSALSTPLPITVIGPLLTRDVTVTEEGDGFRATLEDTTLMGILPFGEVSIKLVAIDEDTYRVSDLQFPKNLDFSGLAQINFDDMQLEGIWSAESRSYSSLKAELAGLNVLPGEGNEGALKLGSLSFDVQKEPDETDTESRFDITLGDVSAIGLGGPDVTIGQAKLLMSANGERPVDLYSLIREVIVVAGMRDSGSGLQTLGQSLLGNTYGTVDLDVAVADLNMIDSIASGGFLTASNLQAKINMRDISARDWGAADMTMQLESVVQEGVLGEGSFEVERAKVQLATAELPVADMLAMVNTVGNAGYGSAPILVSDLLDGLLEFGKIEVITEGKALKAEIRENTYDNEEWVEDTLLTTAYDNWDARISLKDFNKNEGAMEILIDAAGGELIPGPLFDQENLRHVEAWFPKALTYGGKVSNLNEGFLKQLFKDVQIQDIDEPAEIALPLILFASATAVDVAIDGNRYETELFNIEQSAKYRIFPAKFMAIAPFEGEFLLKMSGFDALVDYFETTRRMEAQAEYGDEEIFSILKSVFIVLRNLGEPTADDAVAWRIEKRDVDKPEVVINDTTFYYPELSQFLPMAVLGSTF